MQDNDYISVTELNLYIKSYMENNYFLQDIYVKGEISNFKRQNTGTLYFAIKDEKCAINVVMFPNYANKIIGNLKDGDLVLIKGRISVYEIRGTYSINATEVIFDSKGMLLIQYEELKRKLAGLGLFDESHKVELPRFPSRIGLITASNGAAVQDMLRTIKTRWPIATVVVYPCQVQGEQAKFDIVENIKKADEGNLDVIICGRGGGSIEDLWAFNEEIVAYAFYNCKTPIISAVGHEIDTVISDYVADVRGLTPTDGAVKATPNIKDVLEDIKELKQDLYEYLNSIIETNKIKVSNLKESYVLTNPTKIYDTYQLKLDDLINQLTNKMNINLANYRQKEIKLISSLDSLSPLKVLNRGYGFVTKENKIIKSINDINENDVIDLSLNDGKVNAKVISKEKK